MKEFEEKISAAVDQFKDYLTSCKIRVIKKKTQVNEFLPPQKNPFGVDTGIDQSLPNYKIKIHADMYIRRAIQENNIYVENTLTGDDASELLSTIFSTNMGIVKSRTIIHSFKDLLIAPGTIVTCRDIDVASLSNVNNPYDAHIAGPSYPIYSNSPTRSLRGYHITMKVILHCNGIMGLNVNILHHMVDQFFAPKGFPTVTEIHEEK